MIRLRSDGPFRGHPARLRGWPLPLFCGLGSYVKGGPGWHPDRQAITSTGWSSVGSESGMERPTRKVGRYAACGWSEQDGALPGRCRLRAPAGLDERELFVGKDDLTSAF
jgi:hypothetical protein